jgi:hypothetical protein
MTGTVVLERVENAALAAVLGWFLWSAGAEPWPIAVVLILPDPSVAGYLMGPRIGVVGYNLAHWMALPLALGPGTVILRPGEIVPAHLVAMIWLLHIAVDRAMGYGLKLPSGFRDTHLCQVWRGDQ